MVMFFYLCANVSLSLEGSLTQWQYVLVVVPVHYLNIYQLWDDVGKTYFSLFRFPTVCFAYLRTMKTENVFALGFSDQRSVVEI